MLEKKTEERKKNRYLSHQFQPQQHSVKLKIFARSKEEIRGF